MSIDENIVEHFFFFFFNFLHHNSHTLTTCSCSTSCFERLTLVPTLPKLCSNNDYERRNKKRHYNDFPCGFGVIFKMKYNTVPTGKEQNIRKLGTYSIVRSYEL
ncbi:hypothetical protein CEXT_696931 [Caerostris extrusa]|uniref:Uncharacterized protein n=1 Tax=Caerostris extrusa TaxID=172846 RepID=A0AAV4SCU7_CAEEX|nr:hypothetical protein CEXT_696931 [Caerostris extrusa]